MGARLASLRYVLTNLLLAAFIAALLEGGWLIWVPIGLAALVGGPIDELVGDDVTPAQWGWARFCDFNLYATLPLLVMITGLLLRQAADRATGPPCSDRRSERGTSKRLPASPWHTN